MKPYCFLVMLMLSGLVYFRVSELQSERAQALEEAQAAAAEQRLAQQQEEEAAEESEPEEEKPPEPVFGAVEDDYFDDAVFIGDSRTVGLYNYSELKNSTFYCCTGLTIYKVFQNPPRRVRDGNWKENIEISLQENSFGKIYLMLGINELGVGDTAYFAENYAAMLEHIKELQPDAVIYIQSIMKVSQRRSDRGDYINNEEIDRRNEAIRQLADNERVFYLDVNSAVCDESGALNPEYTGDGVHLYAKNVDVWVQFLRENAFLGFS